MTSRQPGSLSLSKKRVIQAYFSYAGAMALFSDHSRGGSERERAWPLLTIMTAHLAKARNDNVERR